MKKDFSVEDKLEATITGSENLIISGDKSKIPQTH